MQSIVLGIVLIGIVAAYFVYGFALYRICVEYGLANAWLSFVPLANKWMLAQVGDVCGDGLMYIPWINKMAKRSVIVLLNTVGVLALFVFNLEVLGYILYFITSLIIWVDVEIDLSSVSNLELVFDAALCSIGIHSYPAYVLFRYYRYLQEGRLLSQVEDNGGDDEAERHSITYNGADYHTDMFTDDDNRVFEEDEGPSVYSSEDVGRSNVRSVLDEY